jgi:uncharacterized YigZ family protein
MDTFKTIKAVSEGSLTEKKSKFIAYAVPVRTADEAKAEVEKYRKRYYDARHVCWAYMLGADRKEFRANDDGEPSGTAGKPILGQITSHELTDILVLAVRYFGGIKLGTSGLIAAYKGAAAEAIANAEIVEKTDDAEVSFEFGYLLMNDVMKIVKDMEPEIVEQHFDTNCRMTLRIRKSLYNRLVERLKDVERIKIMGKLAMSF